MNTSSYFYHDKPLFGLDIGFDSIKVMQVSQNNQQPGISGYGLIEFPANLLHEGMIIDTKKLAGIAQELFTGHLTGEITTRRVAMGVPAARTFSRVVKLPRLATKQLDEAVRLEAEQYIPVALDELYIDYSIISQTAKEVELFVVAAPRKLIDSYLLLARLLGLEVVALETTVSATARLFTHTNLHDVPTILIDFGAVSADITIFDQTIIVSGTSASGGDQFTKEIARQLQLTDQEAQTIKTKYGLDFSKKQQEISRALQPLLDQLLREIRRMIRYYEERAATEKKISQVITMGGGASMPGLNERLTELLRLPTRLIDPWQHLAHNHSPAPETSERPLYTTVAGLALIAPKEIFT